MAEGEGHSTTKAVAHGAAETAHRLAHALKSHGGSAGGKAGHGSSTSRKGKTKMAKAKAGKGPISQRAARGKGGKAAASARGVKLGGQTNRKARGFGKGSAVITQGAASRLTKKSGAKQSVALPQRGGGGGG